ncbi:MAG: hypothetical protein NC307_13215 [Roseburia sp.]|nr:hypothetical protein [Roseburia sp.]
MEYYAVLNDRTYTLPRYTNSIRSKIDRIAADDISDKLDTGKKFESKYQFIKGLIGEESAMEVFGTDNMEEIDLNDITISYVRILHAYDKTVSELDQESKIASISPDDRELVMELIKNAGNIRELDKMLNKRQNGQPNILQGRF